MTDLLKEAREIISNNKTDKASRDFMTTEQRNALAEDYAAKSQFQTAAHFSPDNEKRVKFEQLFQEYMKPKIRGI